MKTRSCRLPPLPPSPPCPSSPPPSPSAYPTPSNPSNHFRQSSRPDGSLTFLSNPWTRCPKSWLNRSCQVNNRPPRPSPLSLSLSLSPVSLSLSLTLSLSLFHSSLSSFFFCPLRHLYGSSIIPVRLSIIRVFSREELLQPGQILKGHYSAGWLHCLLIYFPIPPQVDILKYILGKGSG